MKLESLEELRVFLQIVESGSLSAAARVLGMPTNTVSRRLQSLEARIDATLLYRTTRSQSLSEAGRTLVARARRILEEVDATEARLEREAEGLVGLIRVSVPSVLTGAFFMSMEPLLSENPGLHIQVEVNDRPVSPVVTGLDLVVIGGTLQDSTLISRKLAELELVVVGSPAYLERRGIPEVPGELAGHRTVHFVQDPPQTTWVLLDEHGTEHVIPVQGKVEVGDGRGIVDAVKAGLGLALLTPRLLREHPDLTRVLPGFHTASFPIHAVYPTSGQRSARVLAVVERLQSALAE